MKEIAYVKPGDETPASTGHKPKSMSGERQGWAG